MRQLTLILSLIIVFASCSPLKPYKDVANDDTPRSEEKRNILSKACKEEFPVKEQTVDSNTVTTLKSSKDSAELAKAKLRADSLFRVAKDAQAKAALNPNCPTMPDIDSLKAAWEEANPVGIMEVKTTVTKKVKDSAESVFQRHQIFLAMQNIADLNFELTKRTEKWNKKEAEYKQQIAEEQEKTRKARRKGWILGGIIAAFLIWKFKSPLLKLGGGILKGILKAFT